MNNIATVVTFSRFIFAITVAILLCFDSKTILLIAVILFILGALSDAIDGTLARKQRNPSRFGAFIDPIADKFLVFLVLISLIYNYDSLAVFSLSILIISREIVIMSLREWMAANNQEIVEVSYLGKFKTFLQMSGICLVASSPLTDLDYFYEFSIIILTLGTATGIISGYDYLKKSYKYLF